MSGDNKQVIASCPKAEYSNFAMDPLSLMDYLSNGEDESTSMFGIYSPSWMQTQFYKNWWIEEDSNVRHK